jgi:hypothetical protein
MRTKCDLSGLSRHVVFVLFKTFVIPVRLRRRLKEIVMSGTSYGIVNPYVPADVSKNVT